MFQLGKITAHEGNKLVIEFEEDINAEYLKTLARDKENLVKVKLLDNDAITTKQNALSHSLIRDIANWYVDDVERMESDLKYQFKLIDEEGFSHSIASKNEATEWIKFLIKIVVKHDVQLEKRYSYLLEYDDFFYFTCKYRKCCVCGKTHGQIHHVEAVGNRKRNNVDHREFPFACLCWEHHKKAHELGQIEFLKMYQVTPVYLDKEALIKIGIMSNAQIMRFDEKYETEELFKKAIESKEGANGGQ